LEHISTTVRRASTKSSNSPSIEMPYYDFVSHIYTHGVVEILCADIPHFVLVFIYFFSINHSSYRKLFSHTVPFLSSAFLFLHSSLPLSLLFSSFLSAFLRAFSFCFLSFFLPLLPPFFLILCWFWLRRVPLRSVWLRSAHMYSTSLGFIWLSLVLLGCLVVSLFVCVVRFCSL
jgi:hypothetical protein